MPNPYTTSTIDSPEYKQLVTGRTDDIATLLDHIAQGHSIALFGERRIGKSSLLFLNKRHYHWPGRTLSF